MKSPVQDVVGQVLQVTILGTCQFTGYQRSARFVSRRGQVQFGKTSSHIATETNIYIYSMCQRVRGCWQGSPGQKVRHVAKRRGPIDILHAGDEEERGRDRLFFSLSLSLLLSVPTL